MSAFKHTPGPWEVAGGYVRTRFDGRNGGFSIARVEALNDQREANAAVLAAAPELLAALRLAVRQNSHDMLMTGEELRQCEAAIAKATGGAA